MNNEIFVRIAGVIQLGILIASALVPGTLRWRTELGKLPALVRQLIWVHGAYIVLMIAAMGLLSVGEAAELAGGGLLGRSVCGFIAIFWFVRLLIQLTVFDGRPYLTSLPLKLGYHCLTAAFLLLTALYGWLTLA